MHSMLCQRVNTFGYFFGSVLNFTVAPGLTCRSTLLSSRIGPVRNDPVGTITWPPPGLALQAAMALANAAEQSVLPSPLAPNAVTSKFLSANVGGAIRARITGTWSQGDAAAGDTAPGVAANAPIVSASTPPPTRTPPAVSPPIFRMSRRDRYRPMRAVLLPRPRAGGGRTDRMPSTANVFYLPCECESIFIRSLPARWEPARGEAPRQWRTGGTVPGWRPNRGETTRSPGPVATAGCPTRRSPL